MTAVQLIVGLGNPGPEYDQTRHNAGALFVERVAESQRVNLSVDRKYFGLVGKFNHQGREVRLLIPTTYMNRSGQSVAALANFFKIKPEEILVAHDELDMPPGVAKLKQGGGHGGHNGLRDIIAQLGNQNNFHRLRLGIGHPGHASLVSGYVLGRAPRSEQELLDQSIDFALDVLPEILAGDWTVAMRKLHSQKATK
ncbi:aminoacyl-tRNA hydrolase [Ectopseudomonas khazarica]|uniref:Peptidyl-tRNA hydrolase n=1 Tax=Ectopseudomonas oleovorans TaxID=301 RepID=A0A653B7K0_ECTOL|nr:MULTISPECIES: aminoacyl-tRNA hydrolase [Pseudomonas]TNF18684.1 MAG: aminoacyl-tRNA hydrolase [Pseudomonadales bacterium]CAE6899629.1 peptidyl-tRNA hydrolase [Pseudomonas oleovorans]MBH3337519.1 aminoacyl-tRNA hydrolase [Pseudomonas mendocina]QTS87593.1 aminoacyl-tRNA hydrolase [Pseudomonas khazarica]HIQ42033.1 aminoacyl-tRNA hydrolase [Pseudomonas oleovorans]|tara:strand:- start:993 stop:1583 length:591 start_codon:yes stop_codon:yes gene_type:complete